jgi:hypothetical protein
VLAGILDRDGTQLSATETRQRNLAGADPSRRPERHLGRRNQGRPDSRYRQRVLATLPPETARKAGDLDRVGRHQGWADSSPHISQSCCQLTPTRSPPPP